MSELGLGAQMEITPKFHMKKLFDEVFEATKQRKADIKPLSTLLVEISRRLMESKGRTSAVGSRRHPWLWVGWKLEFCCVLLKVYLVVLEVRLSTVEGNVARKRPERSRLQMCKSPNSSSRCSSHQLRAFRKFQWKV